MTPEDKANADAARLAQDRADKALSDWKMARATRDADRLREDHDQERVWQEGESGWPSWMRKREK